MKVCSLCKIEKPLGDFHVRSRSKDGLTAQCKQCRIDLVIAFRQKHPEKQAKYSRTSNLRKNFGLTHAEYEALHDKQNGVCAICEGLCSTGRRLAVDHNHMTGEIRGLLCSRCNRGIGLFKEQAKYLLKAAEYVG